MPRVNYKLKSKKANNNRKLFKKGKRSYKKGGLRLHKSRKDDKLPEGYVIGKIGSMEFIYDTNKKKKVSPGFHDILKFELKDGMLQSITGKTGASTTNLILDDNKMMIDKDHGTIYDYSYPTKEQMFKVWCFVKKNNIYTFTIYNKDNRDSRCDEYSGKKIKNNEINKVLKDRSKNNNVLNL